MWDEIIAKTGSKTIKPPGMEGSMYLVPIPEHNLTGQSHWLVGEYKVQTPFATALRHSPELQALLTEHRVRLGLRTTDVPPQLHADRQPRYGTPQPSANPPANFSHARINPVVPPVREGDNRDHRISDEFQNVQSYWATQTPQSHHIVEYNNLRDIKASAPDRKGTEPMDHDQLPCVLLAAEFHQRYISSYLKKLHGLNEHNLRIEMPKVYSSLYLARGPAFKPLWTIARVILDAAKIP